MPGYVIHLAVAEEYLRKHKIKNEKYDEFIDGVIYPDMVKDKSITHYGEKSSKTNLYKFLQENKLDSSFKRGYFLHLITDYLFYNKCIDTMGNEIYNDYDKLNGILINKYKVIFPETIKEYANFHQEGECKILNVDLINKFIDDVSNLDIEKVEKEVIINPEKWTKIRPLKRI